MYIYICIYWQIGVVRPTPNLLSTPPSPLISSLCMPFWLLVGGLLAARVGRGSSAGLLPRWRRLWSTP